MVDSTTPNDPLISSQWHLSMIGRLGFGTSSDISGLARIWADYRGSDINVGIWDDGVETSHWDLDGNYDSSLQVSVNGTVNDGLASLSSSEHGTSVAGLIAAEANGQGGVGIAYETDITSVRIFGGADDINSHWDRYLVSLNSLSNFDVTNHSYGGFPNFQVDGDVAKFANASASGRGGLGTINVKSAGNDNVDGNGEALDASRHTITVAALGTNGYAASYSTYGAHVLVSAPAGSVTTDRLGNTLGYNGLLNGDYTNAFGGTSAAGPITAAVATLMLDANEGLGWRDVQNIFAYSSMGTGSIYGGATTNENSSWKWNGGDNWNGGGLHYSEDYGYGLINAFTAVRMAEVWTDLYSTAKTSANEQSVSTGTIGVNQAIADNTTTTYNFNVSSSIVMEHVDINISLTHSWFPDLRIYLVSPDGTSMRLYDGNTGSSSTADFGLSYSYGVDGYRGELSAGTWQLRIVDVEASDAGTLNSINFTAYGAGITTDDVYHYTDEVLVAQAAGGQSGRITLRDTDGGIDWIDAAAMYRNISINLADAGSSTIAGTVFLTLAAGTVIENAVTGDGNDSIAGNDADNVLAGMRGDDVIDGGNGTDTAMFKGNLSHYSYSTLDGVTTVVSTSGKFGMDTLTNIEFLKFKDQTVAVSLVDVTSPSITSSSPSDNASAFAVNANIVLTFSEAIVAGTGGLSVYLSDGTLWDSFDVSDPEVTISGNTVTINPASNFGYEQAYYILIDAGAIQDGSGNPFAGVSDQSSLNFVTAAEYNLVNGDGLVNNLTGSDQVDQIFGFGGNDTINALGGDDLIDGGTGNDTMTGGLGDDIYVVDSARDRVIELAGAGSGTDLIETTLLSLTLASNVENLTFTGAGSFKGKGNAGDNVIVGGASGDVLDGLAGNDGLDGAEGSDIYVISLAADHQVAEFADSGTGGADEVRFASTVAGTLVLFAGDTGIEKVAIGTGTGASAVTTGSRAINVNASAMLNGLQITGNSGANILTGTAFADTLAGQGGIDTLVGGNGIDLLRGGLANDVLTGGGDGDIFMFDSKLGTSNIDTVTDFDAAADMIRLENTGIFLALTSTGGLAAGAFNTGSVATEADDRIIFDTTSGALLYDADGSGGAAGIRFAVLSSGLSLTAANFEVV